MAVREKASPRKPVRAATNHRERKGYASSSKAKIEEAAEDAEKESSSEEEDVLARTKLDLSNHPMPPLKGLAKTISQFSQLQKLDISNMTASPENEHGLSNLQWLGRATRKGKAKATEGSTFGDRLTWLKMSDNSSLGLRSGMDAWGGIEFLTALTVLNASSCSLSTVPPASALLKLSSLAALVLAHNTISSCTYIPHLPKLNTLVLSHNQIKSLPRDLPANLPSLKKLSITHNALEWNGGESPLPDFTLCSHLREVRLSGNSKLGRLPTHLATWGKGEGRDRMGSGLETLEVADCGLSNWSSIEPLIKMGSSDEPPRRRRGLGNLNLKDNDITRLSHYRQKILEAHPTLRTLDGERLEKPKMEDSAEGVEMVAVPCDEQETAVISKEKKKKEKGTKNELKKISNKKIESIRNEIDESVSVGQEKAQKSRHRGKRGGQTSKDKPAGKDVKEPSRMKKPEKKDLVAQSGEDRAASRAGPPPPPDDKIARRAGPSPQKKKRKAWDEGSAEGVKVEQKKVRTSSPPPRKQKDQTSVAAVIQLSKNKSESSIWGRVGEMEASVGIGSAWQ